jgi:hypothetical protein
MRRPSERHRDELEAWLNKKLPPGSRHHQYWCGIFDRCRCDCDDDTWKPGRRRRPLPGGTGVKPRSKELENA